MYHYNAIYGICVPNVIRKPPGFQPDSFPVLVRGRESKRFFEKMKIK
jgi:hypothetical protein